MRCCSKCGDEKDISEFYLDSKSKKPRAQCKDCVRADNRARAKAHPKKAVTRSQAWRKANPGRASEISRAWQLRNPEKAKAIAYRGRYGIDFEALWSAQDGKCASCGGPMVQGGRKPDSVCVDHDRRCCPGKRSCGQCVRGLIHQNCNLVLGYAKDDPEVLRSAVKYLEQWRVSHG